MATILRTAYRKAAEIIVSSERLKKWKVADLTWRKASDLDLGTVLEKRHGG